MTSRTQRRRGAVQPLRAAIRFSPTSGALIAAAIGSIGLGYLLLARGSTVAAPLLLVLGYVALLPLAILR